LVAKFRFQYAKADYVEGMAVLGGLPIEHGWVEKEGVIIDPTLPDDQGEYFPGLRFQGECGLAKALQRFKRRELPFFYHYGWGGVDCSLSSCRMGRNGKAVRGVSAPICQRGLARWKSCLGSGVIEKHRGEVR